MDPRVRRVLGVCVIGALIFTGIGACGSSNEDFLDSAGRRGVGGGAGAETGGMPVGGLGGNGGVSAGGTAGTGAVSIAGAGGMPTLTCSDGIQNQGEVFVDCGGPCALCGAGSPCRNGSDCQSGVCNFTCQAESCTDGVINGNETATDCGGGICPKCAVGQGCADGARDCQNGVCTNSVCQAALCGDGVKNGTETAIDCGGPDCAACAAGKMCGAPTDCVSKVCTTSICQAPSCSDSVQNGAESAVDCGGGQCIGCPTTSPCLNSVDCESLVCTGLMCQAPTCSDGKKNGTETDTDCGGSCVTSDGKKCASGLKCVVTSDCSSDVCLGGLCQIPTCLDVTKNGVESDIDCGGALTTCAAADGPCARCDVYRNCNCGGDCQSGVCGVNNICPSPPCTCQAPSCPDTVRNQNETDVDCGGSNNCPRCADTFICFAGTDCASGACGVNNSCPSPPCTCQGATCGDGVKNGSETDVDCGGTTCVAQAKKCADGLKCSADTDCASGNCPAGVCVAVANCVTNPACPKDACETDCNCGGCCGATCADGKNCSAGTDCINRVCGPNNVCPSPPCTCQAPTCTDTVKNGTETDTDCGGSCPAQCADGAKCSTGTDCQSKVCAGGICSAPTCPDGQKNGSETDVDCGGPNACPRCAATRSCVSGSDCVSAVCGVNNICPVPPCTCQAPSCSDTVKNQNESDVDCGGICGATCIIGQKCGGAGDCKSKVCTSGVCAPYACNSGTCAHEFSDPSTGVCYCHRTSSQTWANAASACVAWGGQLAALSTKAETDFVNARLTSYGAKDVFIGGTDAAVDGVWKWVNGESWSYTNWLPGEPSTAALDDCVALRAGGAFGWDATNCNGKEHYLCER